MGDIDDDSAEKNESVWDRPLTISQCELREEMDVNFRPLMSSKRMCVSGGMIDPINPFGPSFVGRGRRR